jgi:propionate catabolism operon transcriptional regulator
MGSRICFISPSRECTELYRETLSSLPDPPPIFEGAIKDAETAALAAMKQGYEILVTQEQNARYLWGKVDTPIVAIPLTALDVARTIIRAKKEYGDPVAFFKSHQPYTLLPVVREIVSFEFKEFIFQSKTDCLAKLNQAIREGYRSVAGGAVIIPMARHKGIPCVPLLPLPEDILKTYHQAQHIASIRQIEQREAMKFKYVVQYSFSGIIAADEVNRIVVFNPAAELIFGTPANQVLGQALKVVIPQNQLPGIDKQEQPQLEEMRTIGNKQLMVNRIPIVEEERILGTIFTFQEVSKIQSLEEKIRRAEHAKGLSARHQFQDIIGDSKAVQETILRAQRYASTDETILITGESGTGKEVFAQSIHNASPRRIHPFLAVNCSAISPTLLESELFGYAEGAFTGARRGGKQGMFELAHRGTIFLDEVGELSREAQGHLLRVLQEKEVMRVGDARVTPVNVRVIAAANPPLEKAVNQGLFRWDLYHRLNVLQLRLLPLREHWEDILPLADSFITQWCPQRRLAQKMKEVLAKHEGLLIGYTWPGNVRELQNLLRRIVALVGTMTGDSVEQEIRELLYESFTNPSASIQLVQQPKQGTLKSTVKEITSELIRQQHQGLQGSKSELAKKLGISRTTLWRKLKKTGSG